MSEPKEYRCPACGSDDIQQTLRGSLVGQDTNKAWRGACGWRGATMDLSAHTPREPEWGIIVLAETPRAAWCFLETTPALRRAGFAATMAAQDAGAAFDGMRPAPPWREHPGRVRLAPPERDAYGLESRGLDLGTCERSLPLLGDEAALAHAIGELFQMIPPEAQGSGDYTGATA